MRKISTILFGLMVALAANSSFAATTASAESPRAAVAEAKQARVSSPSIESDQAWLTVSAAVLVLLIVQRAFSRKD
jgi:hypothetical protein